MELGWHRPTLREGGQASALSLASAIPCDGAEPGRQVPGLRAVPAAGGGGHNSLTLGNWESGCTDREEGIWAEPTAPTKQVEGSRFLANFICPSDRKRGTEISKTTVM